MEQPIKNRVAESGIITLDLEQYMPDSDIISFDIRSFLFMDQILKEKDFREALRSHDWGKYKGRHVAVYCSVEAIIPAWAYMCIVVHLSDSSRSIFQGTPDEMLKDLLISSIRAIPVDMYADKRVLIKGCGDLGIAAYAYFEATRVLLPCVKSIMYGEACSAVPVYKRLPPGDRP